MLERFGELGIHIPTLIVYLVNFTLLLIILYFFAYKPILRMLDQRTARIKESMDQAERMREQSAHAQEEIKAQLEATRKEGQAIVAQASQIGERLKEEARQEARQEAEILLSRARREIGREKEEAIRQLRQEFVEIAVLAAEKVVKESLDKKVHQKLIEEVVEQSVWGKG